MTASFVNPAAIAGRQSRRVIGRPGVNPLRVEEWVEVPEDYFSVLEDIAEHSGVNSAIEIARAEGYAAQKEHNDVVTFGGQQLKFRTGKTLQYHTACNSEDLQRLEKAIYEAKSQCDYILVSIHSHQSKGAAKENVPDFLVEFAHKAIDMGAHAVIGHGPHLLRPMELYKQRPVFYSLGDFFLHNESFNYAAEDFFAKYGLTSDAPLCDVYRKRSRNYTCGLLTDRRMLEAVIPYFEFENDRLTRLELLPIELGFDQPRYRIGDPHICTDRGIIQRFAEMSAPYGTEITVNEAGIGIVTLPEME
jgi:poly-gamma-glutamate synthesis protein (capsule biosynthesis protein)